MYPAIFIFHSFYYKFDLRTPKKTESFLCSFSCLDALAERYCPATESLGYTCTAQKNECATEYAFISFAACQFHICTKTQEWDIIRIEKGVKFDWRRGYGN